MKIAIVSTYYGTDSGGGEVSAKLLVDGLKKEGHDVSVITFNDIGFFPSFLLRFSLPLIDRLLAIRLKNRLQKIKPDVIHIQELELAKPTVFAAKKLGLKSVITVRDYRFLTNLPTFMSKFDKRQYFLDMKKVAKEQLKFSFLAYLVYPFVVGKIKSYQYALHNADFLIAISGFIRKGIKSLGVTEDKIKVINNPAPSWAIEKVKKHSGNILFAPGRLEKYKGFQYLIEAMVDVLKFEKGVRLVIAGTGSYEKELRSLVKKLKLDDHVAFTGHLTYDKIKEHYFNCDIVVFPSIWPEPLGRVPLEAMAAGKPLIATNVGGIPEIVDKSTGILVKPRESSEIAKAVNYLIKNTKPRNIMVRNGLKMVRERFNLNCYVEKVIVLYKKI